MVTFINGGRVRVSWNHGVPVGSDEQQYTPTTMAASDPKTSVDAAQPDTERYAALSVEGDALIVYDTGNHRAWVQSNLAVSLDGMI